MCPIYRAEQARLSIASEAGPGGYLENASATAVGGGLSTTLSAAVNSGARSIGVAGVVGAAVNDYIRIEAASHEQREIRKIVRITGTTLFLDYPVGFRHESGQGVTEVDPTASLAGSNFATFLPGVYETITTPDLTPEFLPQYFLSTTGTRNWTYMYRGKQAFTGSLPNFILLNGYPLRFPMGSIATTGSTPVNATTITAATTVGQRNLAVATGLNHANGDFLQVDTGTNAEVRQIISGADGLAGAHTYIINYPFMLAHANAVAVNVVVSPFTHTVAETAQLPSLTWHLLMRDSTETAVNDFIRRYVGGVVNRATVTADEGGLLRLSWDDVQFLDLLHNQRFHSSIGGGTTDIAKHVRSILAPSGIGGDMPQSGGALGTPVYPTTQPYYFSQGALTYFGVALARIRNFRLEITNGLEPRYYVRDLATERIPFELQEQRREYRLSATIATEDSISATATTRSLWKELIVEGNYGSGLAGFDITLVFTRGTNDTITFTIPSATASTTFNSQGAFVTRSPHNIGTDSPIQADVEIMFRNMQITIVDSIGVYP